MMMCNSVKRKKFALFSELSL